VKNSAEIAQVGTISAKREKAIGDMIAEAMQKVGNEGVITVEEAKSLDSELTVVEACSSIAATSRLLRHQREKMVAELDDPYILIHERSSRPAAAAPVLEAVVQTGKPLLIIAEEVEARRLPPSSSTSLRGGLKVAASRRRASADRRKAMLEDIAVLTGARPSARISASSSRT